MIDTVIPAKAGIHGRKKQRSCMWLSWVPACERVKKSENRLKSGPQRRPREGGDPYKRLFQLDKLIPAFAGMTTRSIAEARNFDFFTRSCAGTTLAVIALTLLLLATGAGQAGARDNANPDWPCQQVKVPELSVAAIWPEPLPEKTADGAKEVPGLSDLAARLAARKTPVEEAEKDIAAFVTGTPEERKKKADLLFAGLFDALNAQRFQVMNGIERAYRKQKDFAEKIRTDTETMRGLQDANGDAGQIKELATQLQWETRIFDERRKTLSFACEVPVAIDQRIFALARAIQKAGGMS